MSMHDDEDENENYTTAQHSQQVDQVNVRCTPIFKNSRTRCSRPILGSMKIIYLIFLTTELNLDISASFLDK